MREREREKEEKETQSWTKAGPENKSNQAKGATTKNEPKQKINKPNQTKAKRKIMPLVS